MQNIIVKLFLFKYFLLSLNFFYLNIFFFLSFILFIFIITLLHSLIHFISKLFHLNPTQSQFFSFDIQIFVLRLQKTSVLIPMIQKSQARYEMMTNLLSLYPIVDTVMIPSEIFRTIIYPKTISFNTIIVPVEYLK